MRRYALSFSGLVALVLLLNQAVLAQDKKEKTKVDKHEEIIIKRKSDKDAKVVIEIKGDEVTVNGKPIDDYEGDDIVIRKRRSNGFAYTIPSSPFRSQGGVWNFNGDADTHVFGLADGNTAFLGVTTKEADKGGAAIEEVTKESAAEKAGLKKGDVIKKIDDETIEKPSDLTKAIREHKPEDKVTVTYLRDGKENKVTATLGKRKGVVSGSFNLAPEVYAMPRSFDFDMHNGQLDNLLGYAGRPRLGIKAQDTEDGKGVKVIDIDEESAAEKAGLKEDDIITEFDGEAVNSVDKLAGLARESKEKASVKVKFLRNGKSQTVEIKTPRKLKTANL